MTAFRNWLTGRKTYLLAGFLLLGVAALVVVGKVTPATGLMLLGMCGFPVTFRAAIQQHHDEALAALDEIAVAGVDYRKGDIAGAEAEAVKAGAACAAIAEEVAAAKTPIEFARTAGSSKPKETPA